jgi:hypothetical protein
MPARPGLTGIPAGWAGESARFAVEAVTEMMPLARYFVVVGGALVALLFAFDFFSPKASADSGIHSAGPVDKTTMRIRSQQKLPERIVFDTTQPTIAPKAAQTQAAQTTQAALPGPEPVPEITPKARVRETFAQFAPVEPKKADTTVHKKKRTARAPSQPMHVARYSYFGTSTW